MRIAMSGNNSGLQRQENRGSATPLVLGLALATLVLTTQSGCLSLNRFIRKSSPQLDTSLLEAQGFSVPPGGMPTEVDSASAGEPSVILEIRRGGTERHVERIPLPMDKGVFIEDIVQQAKLHEHLGNLNISIMRPNQNTGAPPIRLDLRTDSKGRANSIGSNYALLPGDHLIVIEDQRSMLERFIASQFTNQ